MQQESTITETIVGLDDIVEEVEEEEAAANADSAGANTNGCLEIHCCCWPVHASVKSVLPNNENACQCSYSYSRFPVGCPKIATRIHACAKFPIQNSRPSARMRGFSSRFLDNQLEIDCTPTVNCRTVVID